MTFSSFRFFLGLDGGGSHCRVRLVDRNGTIISEATAGACNIRLGTQTAWYEINIALDRCLDNAGLNRSGTRKDICALFGLAGFAQSDGRDFLAFEHGLRALTVTSDARIACAGAFGNADGAILILGTGSAGYGWIKGRELSVGGWGSELSDHASGSWIGRKALEYALLAMDGLWGKSTLTDSLMTSFGHDPKAVVCWASTARPADYARHAPTVVDAATNNDPTARMIVGAAARDASGIIQRLSELGAPSVCLSGGLARHLEPFMDSCARARLVPALADPLAGAVLLARETAGHKVRDEEPAP